ncbi:unnamed protein product [Rhizophagus irregularis]|nr:unnamed protein product [Rhizophagus irregularis]
MKNYLPSTSSKKISTYENKEDITQEDTLSSVAEVSDTFGKIKFQHIMTNLNEETLNQVHELLSDYELNSLFERLRLTDEDEYVSAEAHKYMSLFDEIIEEKSCDDGDIEGENKDITDEKDSEEFAK